METWLQTLGARVPPEAFGDWVVLQGLAWTTADVVIVYFLIRLANLFRRATKRREHYGSFLVLGVTVLLMPLLWLAPNPGVFFLVELVITVPHFGLILYLLAANWRVGLAYLTMIR